MSQPRYVHYNPPNAHAPPPVNTTTIAPKDTTKQPPPQIQQPQQPQSNNGANAGTSVPLIATGDWTKDLVHLAKTAELKSVLDFVFSPSAECSSWANCLSREQKTRLDTATSYSTYSFSACHLGAEKQSNTGCQGTEEQVRDGYVHRDSLSIDTLVSGLKASGTG